MRIRRFLRRNAASVAALAALLACGDGADRSDTATVADSGVAARTTAQPTGAASDVAAIRDYELRMEQVDKYYAASRNIALAMNRMSPEEQAQVEMDSADVDLNGYIARLENSPAINQAIRDAGLTAREFSLILWSMLQSGMASAVLDAQPDVNQDSLAQALNVNMANVRFMREHQSELQRKQDSLDREIESMDTRRDTT